ncbi:MAG: rane protein [Verrucomicrobiales bacterium]|nr:rane protein [Verrucomicrobiales bacterium]
MHSESQSPGLFYSLRKFLDTGMGALHNRVELFAVEMREEKQNLLELIVLVSLALFLGMMAMIVITATVILVVEPEKRLLVAGIFCVLYMAGALVAFAKAKARLKGSGFPFAETVSEMRKDRECLQNTK